MSPDLKVTVSKWALVQIMSALNGPPHYIRELQATRNLPELPNTQPNPINVLLEELHGGQNESVSESTTKGSY